MWFRSGLKFYVSGAILIEVTAIYVLNYASMGICLSLEYNWKKRRLLLLDYSEPSEIEVPLRNSLMYGL